MIDRIDDSDIRTPSSWALATGHWALGIVSREQAPWLHRAMEEQKETLLPRHEDDSLSVRSHDHEKDLEEGEGSECGSKDYTEKKTIKGALWVILSTTATLSARKLLRDGGFREFLPLDFGDEERFGGAF